MAEAAGRSAGGFDADKARAAWTAVGEGTAAANEQQAREAAAIAGIEAEIRALEAVQGRPRPGPQPLTDLVIAVEAARELTADLSVTYRVAGARWTPVYDAVLDTESRKVELVRRAMVTSAPARTGATCA